MSVTVSLVSHGHGAMVWNLVDQLLSCPEVTLILVTLNIPEECPSISSDRLLVVKNDAPRGFGSNHNTAFNLAKSDFFCVINPDIELVHNPFSDLLCALDVSLVGLAAPLVMESNNTVADSMRRFLTPISIVRRVLGLGSDRYFLQKGCSVCSVEWVAGMFMLFRSEVYKKLGGFDERYFMYCEDADICTRSWKMGYRVVGCTSASVVHNAQRASRRSLKYFYWHLCSMGRYLLKNWLSLPAVHRDYSRD